MQVAVPGQILKDPRDPIAFWGIDRDGQALPDRVGIPEQPARLGPAEQRAGRLRQRPPPVAAQHRQVEDIEEARIHLRDIGDDRIALSHYAAPLSAAPDARTDQRRKILPHLFEQARHRHRIGAIERTAGQMQLGPDEIDMPMIGNPSLEAAFETDIEPQYQEHRDPDRQPADVEQGVPHMACRRPVERGQGQAVHRRLSVRNPILSRAGRALSPPLARPG
ncbi:hypothetical protein QE360_003405 [Sphingomonas sp. SORGH_AS789]|nr:hypothetical protein [Sphingomonas sp. SORGH_AS_0789]MDR6149889.1 hypothetical protein [Sphingomonas sp. SORGH_AS_0742]